MPRDRASQVNATLIVAGLVISAAGIAVLWAVGVPLPTPVPPGIIILVMAAVFVAVISWRWVPAIGVFIGLYAAVGFIVNGRPPDLIGHNGIGVALGRWIQVIGFLMASIAGVRGLLVNYRTDHEARPTNTELPTTAQPRAKRSITRGCAAQVLGLLVLAPVCAEYLAAYDAATGDPVALLFGLLIFSPLYGAPALLIREVARRRSLGWIGIIFMAAAFGLLQAGVVDQSLFSVSYLGIESWEASRQPTLIEPLGFSAYMAQLFIGGHVIYSICAPIALVEAFRPQHRHEPWLGNIGLAVTAILYVGVSVLVLVDHLSTESSHASAAQVVASLLVVAGLVAGAFLLGRRPYPKADRQAPRLRMVFVVSFVAASAFIIVPETWLGVGVAGGVLVVGAVCLARASRASGWDVRHHVAVAAGALLSRALLAFTYFPVIGDVASTPKYLHNTVLLVAIVVLWMLAARRAGLYSGNA